MRRRQVGIGLLAAFASLPVATLGLTTSASAAPPRGTIQIWSNQNGTATSPIIFTGAIGDYGTATSEDKDGKVDQNGNYVKIVLQQGGFTVNAVALDKVLSKAKPHVSKTNCGFTVTGSGPTYLSRGTGVYVGIKGTITTVLTFVGVNPKLANGKCNTRPNTNPVAVYGTITGSGHVSFS
jgi:FlaG/FlaF family flagellin (archaellin)